MGSKKLVNCKIFFKKAASGLKIWPSNINKQKGFNWAFGFNQFTLRMLGVWPNYQLSKKELSLSLSMTPFIIIIIFICLFLPQMYALVLVIEKLPLIIDNIMSSFPALLSCFKMLFFWLNKQALVPVMKSFKNDWLFSKSFLEHKTMEKYARYAHLITIVDCIGVSCSGFGFFLLPYFGIESRLINNITDYGERYLLVQSYYPYDYSKWLIYELTYTSQFVAGFFLNVSLSIPDIYFVALMFHTSAQFSFLCNKVERLIRRNNNNCRFLNRQYFRLRLRSLVDRHVHLLGIVKILEHSFTFVIMAQMMSTSTMLCCLGYLVMETIKGRNQESLHRTLLLFVALLINVLHTFMICLASEILQLQRLKLYHCIYNCKWYNFPKGSIRDLLPVMVISQNTKIMRIGRMFNLSLQTFSNLLRTTVGYVSVLLAVNQ